jgi:hypothetical protein
MRLFFVFSATIVWGYLTLGVAQAAPSDESRDWIFSGSELTAALEGKSGDEILGEAGRGQEKARAIGYIAGVADTTSGTLWCGAGTVLPHELVDRVYSHLRALGSDRLRLSASFLVVEGLAAAFPCLSK